MSVFLKIHCLSFLLLSSLILSAPPALAYFIEEEIIDTLPSSSAAIVQEEPDDYYSAFRSYRISKKWLVIGDRVFAGILVGFNLSLLLEPFPSATQITLGGAGVLNICVMSLAHGMNFCANQYRESRPSAVLIE